MTPNRPVSATYVRVFDGSVGTIRCQYLVDASGRAGILKYKESLKNVATWGYWRDTDVYAPGTPRANSPYFNASRGKL